jgi:hypothetical protein
MRVPLVAKRRREWLGTNQLYNVEVTAKLGSLTDRRAVVLEVAPILPRWIQRIIGKVYTMFSPVALPAVTLALMLGVGYFLLRPPDINDFYAEQPAVVNGQPTNLVWNLDRAAGASIEPPVGDKPSSRPPSIPSHPSRRPNTRQRA